MTVFWEQGYEASSTDDLLRAMGIGRQSLYDAFGDKRRLYLETVRLYEAEMAYAFSRHLAAAASPLAALRGYLLAIADGTTDERARGCLFVNATTEMARTDGDVRDAVRSIDGRCVAAFEGLVREAKGRGEVGPEVDERVAANHLLNTMRGLRVSAKAGVPADTLRGVVSMALACLGGPRLGR